VANWFPHPGISFNPGEGFSVLWVVFDFGGVICVPQPDADLAALAAAAGAASVADFWAAYWPSRPAYDQALLTAAEFWQDVARRLGRSFTGPQIGELVRLDIASWMHLQAGTLALIQDLESAGQRLAVLSNMPVEVARAIDALPLARHFEHLFFSCDFRAAKPDRGCFVQALDRLGVPAGQVTLVDDRQENVTAAARLGLRAIRFTDPGQARAGLAGIIGGDALLCAMDAYMGSLCAG
jgi:putative hydrolase of the HAD superfamily